MIIIEIQKIWKGYKMNKILIKFVGETGELAELCQHFDEENNEWVCVVDIW